MPSVRQEGGDRTYLSAFLAAYGVRKMSGLRRSVAYTSFDEISQRQALQGEGHLDDVEQFHITTVP